MPRSLTLLALLVGTLVAAACSDATTAPRPNFACETQGSGNAQPCPPR